MTAQTKTTRPAGTITIGGLAAVATEARRFIERSHRHVRSRGLRPTIRQAQRVQLLLRGALAARLTDAGGAECIGPEEELGTQLRDVLGDAMIVSELIRGSLAGERTWPGADVLQDAMDVLGLAAEATNGGTE
jgi:hypothetical protein